MMIEDNMTKEELIKMKEFYINMEKEEEKNEKWFKCWFFIAFFLVCLSFVTGIIHNSFSIAMIFLSWSLSVYFKAIYDQKRKDIKEHYEDTILELELRIATLDYLEELDRKNASLDSEE